MKYATAIVAIIALTVLEIYALHMGINGVAFSGVVLAIGGLGGWSVHAIKCRKQTPPS